MASEKEQWERVQAKTFTNWVNSHLVKRGKRIDGLDTAFQDGVNLIHLLEVISQERMGKFNQNPRMKLQKVENMNMCLKFIADHDVKLASIGAEDIVDGNWKLTLGLVWTIILRFAIAGLSEEGLSAKEGLLRWCKIKTQPYKNVDVQDFTMSFQDGLAFCAIVHRHRPELIDYESLTNATDEDKLRNLNLCFDVCHEHLDVAKLLEAEDIVNMPRPDERSIMTYVAALYHVFSKMDKYETAGRRLGKLTDFKKTVDQLQHDYEQRASLLADAVRNKANELANAPLGHDYPSARQDIVDFNDYRRTQKREWAAEQAELAALFGSIQAKLKVNNLPAYKSPDGLSVSELDQSMELLSKVERERRQKLNGNLRDILDRLRRAFADGANQFYNDLSNLRSKLSEGTDQSLDQQLAATQENERALAQMGGQLGSIRDAEQACLDANIEENEYSDHTADDLAFEFERLNKTYGKQVTFLQSQIASRDQVGISAEQIEEFKESYNHFDQDQDGRLSRLEFKSCLSGLGIIDIDFEGGDAKFEEIFKKVAAGSDEILFNQFVDYMVSVTADSTSPEQLRESFAVIANGKDFITENDLRVAQMKPEQIAYLVSTIPPFPGVDGALDFKAWLSNLF